MLSHPFEPVFDEHSEILILGTFPSVKSRETDFYYGHPQNRFWKVLAAVFANGGNTAVEDGISEAGDGTNAVGDGTRTAGSSANVATTTPTLTNLHLATIAEKKAFLLENNIALWDVISTCDITGSADATITNATPNDIAGLLRKAPIRGIYCNGNKAWELFQKHILPTLKGQVYITEKSLAQTDISSQSDISTQATYASKITIAKLPSTSPANAAWSLEKLVTAWKKELSGTER